MNDVVSKVAHSGFEVTCKHGKNIILQDLNNASVICLTDRISHGT